MTRLTLKTTISYVGYPGFNYDKEHISNISWHHNIMCEPATSEPLTVCPAPSTMAGFEALGLACCVFQTISFARETASVCKAIYQGQKTPDSMLEENATAMIQAADKVKASCRMISTPEGKCLANIAGKCAETAKKLEEEVQKITRLHKEELDGTLDRYRGTMQNLLINQICNRSKALELQQRQDFDKLDQKLQSFIANIAAGRTKMEDLLRTEGTLTREHITAEVTRAAKSMEAHVSKETQEHDTDEDDIDEEDTDEIDEVWQRFVDWLRSGEGLFWIQGKPGSGKSTLVRYIIDDGATQTLLNQWHFGTRIISHFFWKIGTPMQNNTKGLFCSLLYQLLQVNEKLVSFLIRTFPFTESKNYPHDWSDGELERVLLTTLNAKEVEQPVCIFIDGLDEYNGDDGDHGLMDRIQTLIKYDKVKLCVASRPEPRLLNRLNKAPCLKLQDLTGPDMRAHIQTTFNQRVPNTKLSVEQLDALADRLLKKAEGVFLWVHLAIQSVVRGIENEDSYDELVPRLMQLPNALEDLYADMWKRLNQDEPLYRESAATYFQLIIGSDREEYFIPELVDTQDVQFFGPRLTSLYIACATQPTLQETILLMSVDTNFEGQPRELCRKAESEIRTRCAGLVEIRTPKSLIKGGCLPDEENPIWELLNSVQFIHRTAHDFLVDTEQGKQILSQGKLSRLEMYFQTMKGALCWIQLVSTAFKTPFKVLRVSEALANYAPEPVKSPKAGPRLLFQEWYETALSLREDANVLESINEEDVFAAQADERRLGPCRLEQGSFDWSLEVRKLDESVHNPWAFRTLRATAEFYGSDSKSDPGSGSGSDSAQEHDAEGF
ncbi:hypothetical protein CEP52_014152 [Fusarium oligoseptatum]|uniref:Uncharacterized protein n=1 Tax=Fusarium oligoseptatum TaxID=2604345 RepID=A0A428SPM0_9HYPO|nr:hypothetical protein CEP52_014152 [Fusarium oligoseptatum]